MKLFIILLLFFYSQNSVSQKIYQVSDTAYVVKYHYYSNDTFSMKYEVVFNSELLESIWLEKYDDIHQRKGCKTSPVLNFLNLKYYTTKQSVDVLGVIRKSKRHYLANSYYLIPDSSIIEKCAKNLFKYKNAASSFYGEEITYKKNDIREGLYIGVWKVLFEGYNYTNPNPQPEIFDTYNINILDRANSSTPISYSQIGYGEPLLNYLYIYKSKFLRCTLKERKKN